MNYIHRKLITMHPWLMVTVVAVAVTAAFCLLSWAACWFLVRFFQFP